MRVITTNKFRKTGADYKIFPSFETGQSELDQATSIRIDHFPESPEEIINKFKKKKKKKKRKKEKP